MKLLVYQKFTTCFPGYLTSSIRRLSCFVLALASSVAVADFTGSDREALRSISASLGSVSQSAETAANLASAIYYKQDTIQDATDAQLDNILSAVQSIQNSGDVDLSSVESLLTQIRGYVDGLESSAGNIDTSTASSLTSLNQILQALQSFKDAFDDRDFGTDLQNVEAGMQDIEDAIDRLTAYFVDGEASGIESDLSSAVSSALQNNGVTSGRMATIEDTLIDMWDDSSRISANVAQIPSLLTILNTSVSDFNSDFDTYSSAATAFFENISPDVAGILKNTGDTVTKLEDIRLLEDDMLSELKITRSDNALFRKFEEEGLIKPVYQNVPKMAEDVEFTRGYLRRYFAVGGVETNRVLQGIITNVVPIHGTNGTVIGSVTNYVAKYGTNVVNRPKGIFDEFFYDENPKTSNSLFKVWYNNSRSNLTEIVSNQLTQIDYQSNILVAISSITNFLATNSTVSLESLITNGLPWGFALYRDDWTNAHPHAHSWTDDDGSTFDNYPLSLVDWLIKRFSQTQVSRGSYKRIYDLFSGGGGTGQKVDRVKVTNDLYLTALDTGSGQNHNYQFDYAFIPKYYRDDGFVTLDQYNSYLMQSMRDSLALLSYGILDSITNNVDGKMQDFESDDVEMPTSDDMDEFRDEAKSGLEEHKDNLSSALESLSSSGQYAGRPEIVIDFAASGIPGMDERIEIDFDKEAGNIKQIARSLFSWLWRLFGVIYFFTLASHEWDYWISLGRESGSVKMEG